MLRSILFILLAGLAALATPPAQGQTTDAYHALQVFPVVVDTGSFAQRFTFRNPNAAPLTLRPRYYPAQGTTATAITCPDVVLPATGNATVVSLRALCPALPAGSQFGFLTVRAATDDVRIFAGFSRVANPQGQGFSVEAFAAHQFTAATSVVNGIRRLAAAGGAPAFQTNCFVGNLAEIAPTGSPPSTPVHYTVFSSAGNELGGATVNLLPGQMLRLSDIFTVAPAGDYNDASVRFEELGDDEPGILAFCTVQDNTSFGADFRIAKQETPHFGGDFVGGTLIAAQDSHAARATLKQTDYADRTFGIPLTGNYRNAHLVYMRHPDFLSCQLMPLGGLDGQANLEIRISALDGTILSADSPVVANTAFESKSERSRGANEPVVVEVEDKEGLQYSPANRDYQLFCKSGSGHTLGEMIEYQQMPDRF